MTNEALTKILSLPETLKRRGIWQRNGFPFQVGWMSRMIRDFNTLPHPVSITYEAFITLDGIAYKGEIEVTREGDLMIRRTYED